jgi:hypothetical protein
MYFNTKNSLYFLTIIIPKLKSKHFEGITKTKNPSRLQDGLIQ